MSTQPFTDHEKWLAEELGRASPDGRALFAAACATRTVPLAASGDGQELSATLNEGIRLLWDSFEPGAMSKDKLLSIQQRIDAAIPDEDAPEHPFPWVVLAENAAAAASYALQTRVGGDAQHAVWCARQPLEALDFLSGIASGGSPPRKPSSSPAPATPVEQEFAHQREDIATLQAAPVPLALARAIRERALSNSLDRWVNGQGTRPTLEESVPEGTSGRAASADDGARRERHVFISYLHEDSTKAAALARDIQAAGHDVWLSEGEIGVGDSIIKRIDEGLTGATYVILCFSAAAASSPWLNHEWLAVLARRLDGYGVRLLPVRLTGGVPLSILADVTYADLVADWKTGLNELLKAVR